jgi:L-arabonate dehydrase
LKPQPGGRLPLQSGDLIAIDMATHKLLLHVDEAELAKRRKAWKPLPPRDTRGWVKLNGETVMQADTGVDLDFLVGASGAPIPRQSH